jgi:hypothetical protein
MDLRIITLSFLVDAPTDPKSVRPFHNHSAAVTKLNVTN